MAFTVVYDACVLYPAPLRDLLMRIAVSGIVRARWTERILDECFGNLERNRPDLSPTLLKRTRARMCEAVPDCIVHAAGLVSVTVNLPDVDDKHVLEAAVTCGAQAIVTFNLKDFPAQATHPLGIEAKHPDDFVLDSIGLNPALLLRILDDQATALKHPTRTRNELLSILLEQGLPQSVAKFRELIGN